MAKRIEMALYDEAFERLGRWKVSATVLKLSLLETGEKPEVLRGKITAVDVNHRLVSFFVGRSRPLPRLDFGGASFRIGKFTLEAEREGNILMFEEETRISSKRL